ncbi:DUF2147 domain-containing protein [Hymenobacter sediminicola]|uniref:DUF2147 domain-containing protein n=1 Tax=Hymenobacter sediminicola TaxID=2761579 RepID=A0A7G7W2F1_9BACT|nr:DUF2147 domain-containing protein [Hymenobacter sediminicola]QNH60544.1 DUF2147 domain-containing protein [Hymenobacter sediminicola]
MKSLLLSLLLWWRALVPAASQTPVPLGIWADDSGDSHIELYRCGEQLCGRLVWLRTPTDANGKPRLDEHHPDQTKRSQPLHNMTVLQNLRYNAENDRWEDGSLYDPDNGRTYSCYLAAAGKDRLEVKGYIGFSLFGRAHYWQRVK